MKKHFSALLFFVFIGVLSRAQVVLDSSNIPIVGIYTYLTAIPDTPKIRAFMGIIDNGYQATNHVNDTNYSYYGYIGIEQRGSISQQWWYQQKSYGLETRDTAGNDSNAIILGMPIESDWILYSPYDDRTLMRNVLTYDLARQMGYWAARTHYCELLINDFLSWNYKGVYVMMENIKRDHNRVDISKLDIDDNAGDSLTGGYIFAIDSNINAPEAGFNSATQPDLFYSYKYPKGEDITPQQEAYLQAYVDSFERAVAATNFADPVNGYRKYMVDTTFMDFFFFQELSKNVDCYKRSAYLYKNKDSKGGKLHAGPVWDFNSAWHNTPVCPAYNDYNGWAYQQSCWANSAFPVPVWWARILQDSSFTNELKCRWMNWRSGVLSTANIFNEMDSIAAYVSQAQVREYTQYNFTDTFSVAIDTLKSWIASRLSWLDAHMPGTCSVAGIEEVTIQHSFSISPNPAHNSFTIFLNNESFPSTRDQLTIFDVTGRVVHEEKIINQKSEIINCKLSAGVYFVKVSDGESVYAQKLVIE